MNPSVTWDATCDERKLITWQQQEQRQEEKEGRREETTGEIGRSSSAAAAASICDQRLPLDSTADSEPVTGGLSPAACVSLLVARLVQ